MRPQLEFRRIPTEERHYAGFAFKHPMEKTLASSLALTSEGVLMTSLVMRESFSLVNPDVFPDGITIDVTGIKRKLAARYGGFIMVRCVLNEGWVQYILESNGVEEQRVASLTAEDLERPGIMAIWSSEDMSNTTIIDGSHRLVRRWRDGIKTFEMALVMSSSIRKFLMRLPETNAAIFG